MNLMEKYNCKDMDTFLDVLSVCCFESHTPELNCETCPINYKGSCPEVYQMNNSTISALQEWADDNEVILDEFLEALE